MKKRISSAGVHRWRPRLVIAALALATTVLAGCAAPSSPSMSGGAKEPVKLGIVGFSAADATLNKTAQAVVKLAKELGWQTDYQAANPAGDAASANSLMNVMLTKGSTVLLTLAFDTDTLGVGIAAAKSKGVPVLAMSAGKLSANVVWASNVGYVPDMATKIKGDYADAKKVEVLNLTYLLATPGQGRNQLIQEIAKQDPKFSLTDKDVAIPGAVQSGRDYTVAWLAAHPPQAGVDLAIYAVFDQPAEGAVAALKQANRKDVAIYSYDATPAGLQLVKDGYIAADIQNGRLQQAKQAIAALQRVVAGTLTIAKPELVPAAFSLVTTENVAQYEKDFPAAFTEEGV